MKISSSYRGLYVNLFNTSAPKLNAIHTFSSFSCGIRGYYIDYHRDFHPSHGPLPGGPSTGSTGNRIRDRAQPFTNVFGVSVLSSLSGVAYICNGIIDETFNQPPPHPLK